MSLMKNTLLATTLCAAGAISQSLLPSTSSSAPAGVDADGWGVTLRTDSPFYTVGETLDAAFRLHNFTPENAFGAVPTVGGNGCVYSFTIEDAMGRTVWQPFIPCFFGTTLHRLTSGHTIRGRNDIPLVFQNNGNVGVQGAPLPPGAYTLCVNYRFSGPRRSVNSLLAGTDHRACVPFAVEP